MQLVVQAWVLGRQGRRGSWRFSAAIRPLRKLGNRPADGDAVLHPSRFLFVNNRSLLTQRAHRSPAAKHTALCHHRTHGPHHLERRGLETVAPANERSQSSEPFPLAPALAISSRASDPGANLAAGRRDPCGDHPSGHKAVQSARIQDAMQSCAVVLLGHLPGSASVVLLKACGGTRGRGRATNSHLNSALAAESRRKARPDSRKRKMMEQREKRFLARTQMPTCASAG